ncbi:MAG: hypothetical protein ACLPZ0_06600, partial [Steroidobacteraceae bacterium]
MDQRLSHFIGSMPILLPLGGSVAEVRRTQEKTLFVTALEQWLTEVVRSFAERIMPIDQAVADEWGRMSAKRSLSTIDALLDPLQQASLPSAQLHRAGARPPQNQPRHRHPV